MTNLGFINPAMLHGLWAALVPLIIHFLNRRRTVTMPFSNVALIQALQHDRMRRVRLKQVLLLILRTLIIASAVVAFARPTLHGGGGRVGGSARTAAVLLLDRSLSMQHRTPEGVLFDRARARVREALRLFDVREDVHLIQVDQRAEVVEAAGVEGLKLRLDSLRPSFRTTNLKPGIEAAVEHLLQSELLNREIYLFTDLARNGWSALPDSLPGLEGVSVFIVPERPSNLSNVGIGRASSAGQLLSIGNPATLAIELVNRGARPHSEVALQAYLGGNRVAQTMATVPAGETLQTYFRFTPRTGGALPLRVEIGDDDLMADNVYTSVLNVPEGVIALLVGESEQTAYYLERALGAAATSTSDVSVQRVRPHEITADLLAEANVIFLCNVARLSHGSIAALKDRMETGAGVMICLGDRVDVRHYNERLLPALFPASLIGVTGVPGRTETFHTIEAPSSEHPMFRGLVDEGTFESPRFYAHYRLRLHAASRPVLAFTTGSPAVAERRAAAGRALLFAAPVDPDWTDLPLSGLYVPLVHRVSRYLAAGALGTADYVVGEAVYRNIRGVPPRESHLRPPQGESRTLWPEQRGSQPVWPVGEVDVPGFWEIYAQEQLADRFAVRIPIGEPDLTPVPHGRLERLFGQGELRVIKPEELLADIVALHRHGRELWRLFLGLAAALMAAEMLISRSHRTARGERSPGPVQAGES